MNSLAETLRPPRRVGDVLVRALANSSFYGVEGGSSPGLRWRVWWNGRIDSFHSSKAKAEARYQEIVKRGWA
jgi:hypothetical protein